MLKSLFSLLALCFVLDAEASLAKIYASGIGVTQSFDAITSIYRKSAEQGDVAAQNNLATLYELGKGVPHDPEQAAFWYTQAAESGNISAQMNLASMYWTGRGTKRDYTKALIWYRKAAELGNSAAQERLALREPRITVIPAQAGIQFCKRAREMRFPPARE